MNQWETLQLKTRMFSFSEYITLSRLHLFEPICQNAQIGGPSVVMSNVLLNEVNEFEPLSPYYVHIWINPLGGRYESFYFTSYELSWITACNLRIALTHEGWYAMKQRKQPIPESTNNPWCWINGMHQDVLNSRTKKIHYVSKEKHGRPKKRSGGRDFYQL